MERSRNLCILIPVDERGNGVATLEGGPQQTECDLVYVRMNSQADVPKAPDFPGIGELRVDTMRDSSWGEYFKQMILLAFEDGYERCALVFADLSPFSMDTLRDVFELLNDGSQVVLKARPEGTVECLGLGGVYLECVRDVPWGTGGESIFIENEALRWHRQLRRL